MGKLFFFGDSITAGAWDEHGGWANRLCGQVMQKTVEAEENGESFYCLPYNLGVSGDRVSNIFDRMAGDIARRLDVTNELEPIQLVFAAGINDSVYRVKEERPQLLKSEFEDNLDKVIALAKRFTENITFIGLTPVDEGLLNPIPWAPEKAYRNDNIKAFETIIADKCQKKGLKFLPLFDNWMAMPEYKTLLSDGAHPNSKGHALLAEQIGHFIITQEFTQFHSS